MPSSEREPMTGGRVLVPSEARTSLEAPRPQPELAWRAFRTGLALLALVALIDLALLWVPLRLGNPEWEFGTFTQTIDSLPLVSMMTLGLVGVGLFRASYGWPRFLTVWCWAVVVAVLVIVVLYLLNVPLIWQRASSPDLQVVMRKAIVKLLALSTLYVSLYGFLGLLCLRGTRNIKP